MNTQSSTAFLVSMMIAMVCLFLPSCSDRPGQAQAATVEVLDIGQPPYIDLLGTLSPDWRTTLLLKPTIEAASSYTDGEPEKVRGMPDIETTIDLASVRDSTQKQTTYTASIRSMRAVLPDHIPGEIPTEFQSTYDDLVSRNAVIEFVQSDEGVILSRLVRMDDAEPDYENPHVQEMYDGMIRSAADGIAQMLYGLAIPLPDEPMGSGGKWRVRRPNPAANLTATEDTTYTFKSYDNGVVHVSLETELLADAQPLPPNPVNGLQAMMTSQTSIGRGDATLSLASGFVTRCDISIEFDQRSYIRYDSTKTTYRLLFDTRLQIDEIDTEPK